MSIDGVTGSIMKDGKEVVSTLGDIFGKIERITIALTGLYLLSKRFPAATKAIKEAVSGITKELSKASPFVAKLVEGITKQFTKLAKTDIGKSVGLALAAPLITKALLLLAAAAVITAGAFAKVFLSQAHKASELNDLQDALDQTTDSIQGLQAAAEVVTTPFEGVVSALQHITKAQSEVVLGSEEMTAAMKQLGFTVDQVKKLSSGDIFKVLNDGVRSGKIGVGQRDALLKVMGKDAKNLIPALKDDISGIAKSLEKWAVNPAWLNQLDEANTKLRLLWANVKGFGSQLAAGFAIAGTVFARTAKNMAGLYGEFAKFGLGFGSNEGMSNALNKYSEGAAKDHLLGDKDYANSLRISAKLESQLSQKQSIRDAEKNELEILKEKNKYRERDIELAEMTASQRKASLETERDALKTQIAASKSVGDRAKLQERLYDVRQELAQRHHTGFTGEAPQVDSMTRIGLFHGGALSPMQRVETILNRTESIQREIVNKHQLEIRTLDRMLKETEQIRRMQEDV